MLTLILIVYIYIFQFAENEKICSLKLTSFEYRLLQSQTTRIHNRKLENHVKKCVGLCLFLRLFDNETSF